MRIKGMGERELALLMVAALIGRVNLIGANPFAIGMFIAICYEKLPRFLYGIALLAGIVSSYGLVTGIKYSVIFCFCVFGFWLLEQRERKVPLWFYSITGSGALFFVEYFWKAGGIATTLDWSFVLLETLMAGVFGQILYVGLHYLLGAKRTTYAGNEEMISMIILGSLLVFGMPFQGNSQFHVLSMFLGILMLVIGYRYGAGAGSLAGAISGVFFLQQEQGPEILGILAILGVGAGVFRELGRAVSGLTFFLLYLVCGKYFSTELLEPAIVRGVVAGIAVFLFLPKSWTMRMETAMLEKEYAFGSSKQIEKKVRKQLEHFAEPFFALSKTFQKLSDKKAEMEEQDVEQILQEVSENLCAHCEKSNRCLGFTRHDKYQTASCILPAARRNGYWEEGDFPMNFVNKCDYLPSYVAEANQALRMVHSNMEWQNKMAESRDAIAGQFQDIGMLLREFATEICKEKELELEQKRDIAAILKRNQMVLRKLEKVETNKHCQEIHLIIKSRRGVCVTTKELANCVSSVLEKNFIPTQGSKNVLSKEFEQVVLVEDTKFKAITGMAKRNKDGELVSGDAYSFLRLDSGELVMTLADGMGSGEQACTDSTSVVELLETFLEAGVGERTAIHLINSIFVLKSEEQKFSTLDMAILNLYTGVCDFIKMGAAAAYIKRDNWVEQIESTTLPMGVVCQVEYEDVAKKMYDGDYIILVSDGIVEAINQEEKEDRFQQMLSEMEVRNPDELANYILEQALVEEKGESVDDKTVLVVGMWKK